MCRVPSIRLNLKIYSLGLLKKVKEAKNPSLDFFGALGRANFFFVKIRFSQQKLPIRHENR
jgi:hypothetical protein